MSGLTSALARPVSAELRRTDHHHDRSVVSADLLRSQRCICSIDVDCFYAQCEELRNPELKGKPIGVQQKALVITSNYAARAFGIKKGDSLKVVREKCPQITICNGEDLTYYGEVSARIFDVAASVASKVERLGSDEVFVDITDAVGRRLAAQGTCDLVGYDYAADAGAADDGEAECRRRLAAASVECDLLRQRILDEVGVTTSAGVSVSKLLSKLVASERKPHQQTVIVPTAAALAKLIPDDMPIHRIPGVGSAMRRRWASIGVHGVAQLVAAAAPPVSAEVCDAVGGPQQAAAVARLCEGRCDEPVKMSGAPQTIGVEDSFWTNPLRPDRVPWALAMLSRKLVRKLRSDQRRHGHRPSTHLQLSVRVRRADVPAKRHTRQQPLQLAACGLGSADGDDERAAAALAERALSMFPLFDTGEAPLHILGVLVRLQPPVDPTVAGLDRFVLAKRDDVGDAGQHPPASKGVLEYTSTSRLSFLGQWRSRFRRFAEPFLKVPPRHPDLAVALEALPHCERSEWVMHVDADAFFLAVHAQVSGDRSIVDRPSAVCSGRGATSEVCSASYAARQQGVGAGMFVSEAMSRCPNLEVIPVTPELFTHCAAGSQSLYKAIIQVSSQVLPLSCDEAIVRVVGDAPIAGVAAALRDHVQKEAGLKVSCGVGPTCITARIATRRAKPPNGSGVHVLAPEDVPSAMASMDTRQLSGIGRSTARKLADVFGVTSCAGLREVACEKLQREFGKVQGKQIWDMARGSDPRPPEFSLSGFVASVPKSLQVECNFRINFRTLADALAMVAELSAQAAERASEAGVVASRVGLRLLRRRPGAPLPVKQGGHGICDAWSRTAPLQSPTADADAITRGCSVLYRRFPHGPSEVRGVGVSLTGLASACPEAGAGRVGLAPWASRGRKADAAAAEQDSDQDLFTDSECCDVTAERVGQKRPASPTQVSDSDSSGGVEIVEAGPPAKPRGRRKRRRAAAAAPEQRRESDQRHLRDYFRT